MRVVCKFCGTIYYRGPSTITDVNNFSCTKNGCIRKRSVEKMKTSAPINKKPFNRLKELAMLRKERSNDKLEQR